MQHAHHKHMTRKQRQRQLIQHCAVSGITFAAIFLLLFYFILPSTEHNHTQDTDQTIDTTPDGTDDPAITQPEEEVTPESDPSPVSTQSKLIALTYDDGPCIYTDDLLDILEQNNAKATFFVVGSRVEQFPDTIKRMDSLGMEIGSHTYGHDTLTELDASEIKETMDKTDKALSNILGHGANLMRPVGGSLNELVQEIINKPIIRWSVDTEDWKSRDSEAIIAQVLENVTDGCIILMHDLYPTTIEATEVLIPKLQELGYQLVTVQELADARGVTLKAGEIYRRFPNTNAV